MSFQHMLAMASGAKAPDPPPIPAAKKTDSTAGKTAKQLASKPTAKDTVQSPGVNTPPKPVPKPASRPAPKLAPPNPAPKLEPRSQTPARPQAKHAPNPVTRPIAKPKPKAAVSARANVSTKTAKRPESAKKLSFKDIMKKANTIDKDKLKMTIKTRDGVPESKVAAERATARKAKLAGEPLSPVKSPSKSPISRSKPAPTQIKEPVSRKPSAPAPVAQPFPELLARRRKMQAAKKANSRNREDDGSDLSDFVVSDEEEEQIEDECRTSHRDEIWQMFNRRPREEYDHEYSDDDMEASGHLILEEEKRSFAQARREDRDEQRRLEELAARKKLRLQGKAKR